MAAPKGVLLGPMTARKVLRQTCSTDGEYDASDVKQYAASGGDGSTAHAKTNAGGIPPKIGLQMGSSLGKKYTCGPTGLLVLTVTDILLYNPSTGAISASADVVYSINDAGLAVVVVEDCAVGNCSDALPVVTSTGPFTKASGSSATITLTGTGTILSWTITGTIPAGLTRTGTGGSAALTGTPTTPGTYSLVIAAANCAGSASVTIVITIT